jgi:signal peptidase I
METDQESPSQDLDSLANSKHVQAGVRAMVAEWAVTVLVMLFASTSLAWSYVIPTGSMEDTLLVGDHIVVDKLAYAQPGAISKYFLPYETPKDGDIIAFRYPVNPSQMFVKRIIGAPGDRIKIINRQVYRNGTPIREPYAYHRSGYLSAYRDNFPANTVLIDMPPDFRRDSLLASMLRHVKSGELVIPPNEYFAMGDNRDNSLDSRYWGFVPRENIVGKPVLIFWSYDAPTNELMPGSAGDFARHLLDVGEHFLSRTRWDRMLRPIRGYHELNN